MKTRKIWIGIGAFVVVGAGVGAASTSTASWSPGVRGTSGGSLPMHRPAGGMVVAQHGGEAGEAGEGGEGGVGLLPPDLAFAVRIALIRGHLGIGDELVRAGQWAAALPHFLHPSEEIYKDLSEQLKDYNVPPFERALATLSDTVKAKRGGAEYARSLSAVNAALAGADGGLRAKQGAVWAGFIIEAAVELLKVAGGEYGNALEKGRIGKPVEYQDARGFIFHAERMIEGVARDLEKKDAAALKQVRAGLAEMKKLFPTAMPPRGPVKEASVLLGEIARVELAAGRLM